MKLPNTTRARLAIYRKRAAENKHGHNDWRGHRYGNTWGTAWHSELREDGKIYTDNKDTLGDYVGDWCDFAGYSRELRDTNGFYADNFCYGTIKGGVVRLRGAKCTLYIPCTFSDEWDGATLHFSDAERVARGSSEDEHDKAKREAANSAFYAADKEAEVCREDDAKFQAEEQTNECRDTMRGIVKDTRAIIAAIREQQENGQIVGIICQVLRDTLKEKRRELRENVRRIHELKADCWLAVQ